MTKLNAGRKIDPKSSFFDEDYHALVSTARLPRLDNCHELVEHGSNSKKHKSTHVDVLKQCFVLSLESTVYSAQRAATLPPPEDLASLPLFQQARETDVAFLQECHARRKELQREEERRRLEEKRLEAERRLEREKEREEQRKKRMEAKELRRQERMEAKRERMGAVQERKMRAYEEAYEKWERNYKEHKLTLDAAQEKIKMLERMKLEREGSLRDFDMEKEELLETLRSSAVRADSLPAKEKAAREKAEREAKEKAEKEAKERMDREKKRDRERDAYKYTPRTADITIVAKPQAERFLEARSPSFREREREREREKRDWDRGERDPFGGAGARKSLGIRDGGGYRYVGSGGPGDSSPFSRGGASIRDSRPHDRDPRDGRPRDDSVGLGNGHSIRRGPPMSARYGGGASIRDVRDPRDMRDGSGYRGGRGGYRGGYNGRGR